jgi:predicted alpha/beta-fold hydrolase
MLVGYSMGGNLVPLAGELGTAPAAVRWWGSPAVDLGPSADAMHFPQNRLYELKFLRNLLSRFRRKAVLFPRAYDRNRAVGIHSLREFDDRITALYSGFSGADDYYDRAAAARVLDRVAVPTLALHALDDPFIRLTPESRDKISANPNFTLIDSSGGGIALFSRSPTNSAATTATGPNIRCCVFFWLIAEALFGNPATL